MHFLNKTLSLLPPLSRALSLALSLSKGRARECSCSLFSHSLSLVSHNKRNPFSQNQKAIRSWNRRMKVEGKPDAGVRAPRCKADNVFGSDATACCAYRPTFIRCLSISPPPPPPPTELLPLLPILLLQLFHLDSTSRHSLSATAFASFETFSKMTWYGSFQK